MARLSGELIQKTLVLMLMVTGGQALAQNQDQQQNYITIDDGKDDVFVMAALGDSITTAFNAKRFLNNKSLSWSTGDSDKGLVNSHYNRIRQLYSGTIVAHNMAKVGSTIHGVVEQMARLETKLQGQELDYLTIMVGGNDTCVWPTEFERNLEGYRNLVEEVIERAKAINENVKIVLVAVPNMVRLYQVGVEKGCSYKWKLYPMCPSLLRSESEDERLTFGTKIKSANDALEDIAQKYPDNVRIISEVATFEFQADEISQMDCFHPTYIGQKNIAEVTWKGGWYAREPENTGIGF